MIFRVYLLTHALLLLLVFCSCTRGTYTVTVDQYYNLPLVYGSAYTSFNSTIYSYGGKTVKNSLTLDSGDLYQVSIPNPTNNGSDVSYKLLSSFGATSYGQMVYLAQSHSLLMIGGATPNTTSSTLVLTMYHFENSTWSPAPIALNSLVPVNRQRFGAALSPVNNLVYIYGGLDAYNGTTFVSDFWSYNPITGVFNNLTSTLPFPAGQASSLVSLSYVNLGLPLKLMYLVFFFIFIFLLLGTAI